MDPQAVYSRVKDGRSQELVGQPETSSLEFKGQPFDLTNPKGKAELAKDVSAFCNAGGGIIVLGVRTENDPEKQLDIAKDIRPFPPGRVDPKQHEEVLHTWIYPPPTGVTIRHHTVPESEGSLVSILVPAQAESAKPFLVLRDQSRRGNRSGAWFGLYRRTPTSARPVTAQEVHVLMRDGAILREILNRRARGDEGGGLPPITVGPLPPKAPPDPAPSLAETVVAADLADLPTFGLTARPTSPVDFSATIASDSNNLVQSIDRPPELRDAGFDLSTGGRSELVEGRVRRSTSAEHRGRDVWRDGTVAFAARGDETFLCWASKFEGKQYVINPVVLLETTFLFALWVHELYGMSTPRPEGIEWGLSLARMNHGKNPPAISLRWPTRNTVGQPKRDGPGAEVQLSVSSQAPFEPERVAADLIAETYAWFGVETDRIPLLLDGSKGRIVDVAKIREL